MKPIIILVAIIFSIASIQPVSAQTSKEMLNMHSKKETIKVYGECGMCKKRIENAAMSVEGIEMATWSEQSKILSLQYDSFKPEAIDQVQKKIAAAGHDTDKYKADDAVYQKLPGCCHYQRKQ